MYIYTLALTVCLWSGNRPGCREKLTVVYVKNLGCTLDTPTEGEFKIQG